MDRVLVASSAWTQLTAEVDRRFPDETALYPLGAWLPDHGPSPLEALDWAAAGSLVLTHVLLPDPAAADFGPTHARFHPEQAGAATAELQARAEAVVARHPRLAFLTKMHSHPFGGGDFLSGGDVACNVRRPGAQAWWSGRGLSRALLLVAHPTAPPPSVDGWRVACFAVDFDGRVERLADALPIPDDDARVQAALAPPYWATAAGSAWCDGLKQALRDGGLSVSRNLLGRGWRRYLLRRPGASARVLALPPDLPAAPARLLEIRDARTDDFRLLAEFGPAATLEALGLPAALLGER